MTPNRAAVPNAFSLALTRNGKPVPGAEVITKFDMLDMEMGEQSYRLREQRPGVVLEVGARARDGRALGAPVRGHAARREAVRRHAARQGERMRARLLIALVAVAAAAAAWVIVLEALRRTM